jgi:pimeloyl-ACP methyl ester carboxylesterase
MTDMASPSTIDTTITRTGDGQFAVIFIHGFLDDRHVWDAVVSQLDTSAFEAVQVDLAGSGSRVDAAGPFDYDRFAADVVAVADRVGKPFVVVGQSMGSAVAELLAAARPDLALGLILVTPVPLAGVGLPDDAIEPFRGLGGDPEGQRAARKQLSAGLAEADLERLVDTGAGVRPEVVRALADCWNGGHPDGAHPSRYAGPVLVLRGAEDPFATDELVFGAVTPRLHSPGVALVEGAGHWAHVEQAAAVAARIREFLDQAIAQASANTAPEVRPHGWTQAFADKSEDSFAEAFAEDVVLEASALQRPAAGRDLVKSIMAAASNIYESLVFTHEASQGARTYLEWEATAFGGLKLFGITVLTKDGDGRIVRAAIHHRPLGALQRFSAELRRVLDGTVDPDYFYGG